MLKDVIEKALNKQIELEASSSQFYLSMASWTETKGLSGSSDFLYQHSDEERLHMLKLVKFINERGGNAIIPALIQPPKIFKSLSFPTATVVVAHSPTPSAVKTTASLKGDGKKALEA